MTDSLLDAVCLVALAALFVVAALLWCEPEPYVVDDLFDPHPVRSHP